jgi:hypothetical protein
MAHDSVDQPSAQPQAWGRYALPLMLGFAVVGGVIGFVLESATGGADPAFAATLGGALGGVFGRAVWRRRRDALAQGPGGDQSFAVGIALLVARIAACGLLGIAIVGSLRGASGRAVSLEPWIRAAMGVVGALVLVLTSAAEARRIARLRATTASQEQRSHVD